tara:strand:+ start:823 stop:1158 length:336 start_codon:yes stop_codon:yes gene_type:complete
MSEKGKIEVRFRKLGREKAFGLAWCDQRVIEVDESAHKGDEMKLLDTICHEVLHIANPRLAESTVLKLAAELAPVLYNIGYRRIHINETTTKDDPENPTKAEPSIAPEAGR